MNKNSGASTLIVIIAIFILGILSGGLFYFIGSQSSQVSNYSTSPTASPQTGTNANDEVSALDKELENTQLDSIDSDLKDIDKDASTIK